MQIDDRKLDRILPTVQKPARYIGGEFNSIAKDWDNPKILTKVALVFPDVYDLGMSNLGLAILYDLLNQREDTLAERGYIPWPDMEAGMRAADMPLYALESRRELRDFDLIGISLPYEQLYTNVLTTLDLARMPLLSVDRDESYPLVCAGGNAVFNPEPMADFIDFFVMGEGEDVIIEVIEAKPHLLGIGIDENTAIVVEGDEFEVMGQGYVAIYDHERMLDSGGKFYFLAPGDQFNMQTREATRPQTTQQPLGRVVERQWPTSR